MARGGPESKAFSAAGSGTPFRMLAMCAGLLAACGSHASTPRATPPPKVDTSASCVEPIGTGSEGLLPELTERLGAELPAYSSGPIVVLDLETGDLRTICGDAAEQATKDWARLIRDPARHRAVCMAKAAFTPCGITCMQGFANEDILEIELRNTEPPQITSVLFGRSHALQRLAHYIHAFRTLLAHAECPSRSLRRLSR